MDLVKYVSSTCFKTMSCWFKCLRPVVVLVYVCLTSGIKVSTYLIAKCNRYKIVVFTMKCKNDTNVHYATRLTCYLFFFFLIH